MKNSGPKLRAVAAMLLLAALPRGSAAGEGLTSWRIEAGMSSVYDDNILRYSEQYLTRFDNREDAGRFHVRTRDDLILVGSMRASATFEFIGRLKTTAAAEFRQRTYVKNGIKDWLSYSAGLRQDLGNRMAVWVGYRYTPEFYLRHHRDDDWVKRYGYTAGTFQPFGYEEDAAGFWLQRTFFQSTRVRTSFSYVRYFHNEHFTEYDCRNRLIGAEIHQSLGRNIAVTAAYGFAVSAAKGSIEADPSYEEDSFTLGADVRLPDLVGRNNSLGVDGEYARRCFTTRNVPDLDRLHAGRRDYDYRVSLRYSFQLTNRVFAAVTGGWHRRDAATSVPSNAEYLSDEKDYRQYQIGVEAKYIVSFFTGDGAEPEGEL